MRTMRPTSRTVTGRAKGVHACPGVQRAPPARSAVLVEEHERSLHALADVLRAGEAELGEDRVDVLLDGALGQHERLGDRRVALALRHLGEHLALTRRDR